MDHWPQLNSITLQMQVMWDMGVLPICALRTALVKVISPSFLVRAGLHLWNRWPYRGWSLQQQFWLSKLILSCGESLAFHWREAISGVTVHRCWAISRTNRPDFTCSLPKGLLWSMRIHLHLSGLMYQQASIPLMMLPEVLRVKLLLLVIGGNMDQDFCGSQKIIGHPSQRFLQSMEKTLKSRKFNGFRFSAKYFNQYLTGSPFSLLGLVPTQTICSLTKACSSWSQTLSITPGSSGP